MKIQILLIERSAISLFHCLQRTVQLHMSQTLLHVNKCLFQIDEPISIQKEGLMNELLTRRYETNGKYYQEPTNCLVSQ